MDFRLHVEFGMVELEKLQLALDNAQYRHTQVAEAMDLLSTAVRQRRFHEDNPEMDAGLDATLGLLQRLTKYLKHQASHNALKSFISGSAM